MNNLLEAVTVVIRGEISRRCPMSCSEETPCIACTDADDAATMAIALIENRWLSDEVILAAANSFLGSNHEVSAANLVDMKAAILAAMRKVRGDERIYL